MNGGAHYQRSPDGIMEARTVEGVQRDATQGRKPEEPWKGQPFTNFDWGYFIPNTIYPEEIEEDKFYIEETNKEIFFPKVLEESDGEYEEQSFNYYPQNLKRIELRLKDLGIKKLFKPRKTSPTKIKKTSPTRLQKPAYYPTTSSIKFSIT